MEEPLPQPPRWLASPQPMKIRIQECVKGPFPEEVAIRIKINGESVSAMVPADMVTEEFVHALKIGETDDRILIALPTSTISSPYLWIPKRLVAEVLAA